MTIVDDQPENSCAGHQACQVPACRGKWVVWGALVKAYQATLQLVVEWYSQVLQEFGKGTMLLYHGASNVANHVGTPFRLLMLARKCRLTNYQTDCVMVDDVE